MCDDEYKSHVQTFYKSLKILNQIIGHYPQRNQYIHFQFYFDNTPPQKKVTEPNKTGSIFRALTKNDQLICAENNQLLKDYVDLKNNF
jgi:hypothetical protein